MVGAVACLCTWDGRADLWADDGIPCVRGHALSMQAIQGGKAKHDQSDSHQMAAWLRGGMRPQADVSPATMRATRDVLRRRMPLAHHRAALLAHVPHTHRPYTLPAMGTKLADTAHRAGVAERCAEAAVHKRSAGALALLTSDDALLRAVARTSVNTAKQHDATTLSLRHTVPGIGQMLSRGLRDAIPAVHRVPRGQDVVSSCRLVTWVRASAGKRYGTSGATIGQAPRKGACAEAAVLCRRDHPAAHTYRARVEKNHAKGHALTILAQQRARAVSDRLTRPGACEREKCFQRSTRREGSG
jgi:hypothetical protein